MITCCNDQAPGALASEMRRLAATRDTAALRPVFREAAYVRDTGFFNAALDVAGSSTASNEARAVALLVAATQLTGRISFDLPGLVAATEPLTCKQLTSDHSFRSSAGTPLAPDAAARLRTVVRAVLGARRRRCWSRMRRDTPRRPRARSDPTAPRPHRNFPPPSPVGSGNPREARMDGDVLMFAQVMTVIVTTVASLVAIGLGARVLWRWGSPRRPAIGTPHDDERQQRLETAVDAIAIEVERISEAQRFMVGLLSESVPVRRAERAGELGSPDRSGRVITPH